MNIKIIGVIISLLLISAVPARANELDAAVTWSCQAEKGTLIINYLPSLEDSKPEMKKANPLVFYSLIDLDQDGTTVIETRSREIVCQLKKDKLEIRFEPGVPNLNLLGRCGAAITGVVTVKRNGAVVLNEKEFEDMNCQERKRFIKQITFKDGSAKPEIKYGKYKF